ncbi:FAD:protein FMN transferase ApbE [Candidatus Marinamargulisbacteria bacterium SCGC AAA071-K20]|nr:FAD:protein FMN transferase ApbE [Candidatus Marinamargulisbacteria bacterium SCGC AAA071-K20]
MIKRLFFGIIVGGFLFLFLNNPVKLNFSGQTMGTTYSITTYGFSYLDYFFVHRSITKRLEAINQSMSTYSPTSEISRFNALSEDAMMTVSQDFYDVLDTSKMLYKLTDGAWDPTIKPLVDRWGFSEKVEEFTWPSQYEITELKKELGFDFVQLIPPNKLKKNRKNIFLDLSSIAKGYGVDAIIEILKTYAVSGTMVEIGGEVRVFGLKPDIEPWKVGLNSPDSEASKYDVSKVVVLKNKAVATSGDYRNFKTYKGKRYSHIIDPRTGFPVSHSLSSVSVIAPTCMFADALATACLVLGEKKAINLIKSIENVDLIILNN